MTRNLLAVVGARPNFMKVAPILRCLRRTSVRPCTLVHTGQHYGDAMSHRFFSDLDLPIPEINLEVGSGSHGAQTGEIMKRLEPVLVQQPPAAVLVVGDVNSTLAAALVASKLHIPVVHVEAGLRSFDRQMPEEINRTVTDVLSDLLFVTEPAGVENLSREGILSDRVFLVGDVMIDSLVFALPNLDRRPWPLPGRSTDPFGVVTLHRPSNVDAPHNLRSVLEVLKDISHETTLVFPVHPRTRARLEEIGMLQELLACPGLILVPPLGYLDFIRVLREARFILTDSGGVQCEASYLGIPCLTLRDTTERPDTLTYGGNRLLGTDPKCIPAAVRDVLSHPPIRTGTPPLSDGRAAERIMAILNPWLDARSPL